MQISLKTLVPIPSRNGFKPGGSVPSGDNRSQPTVWISISVLALVIFLGPAFGYFIGIGIPLFYLLVAFLAMILGFVSLMKPEFGLLLLVAVIFSSINEVTVTRYGMPSVNIFLTLLVLLATLANKLVLKREKLVWDNQNLPLLAYGGIIMLSVFVAVDQELAIKEGFQDFIKDMIVYFIIIILVASETSIRRLTWQLLTIGALLGSLGVFQGVTGSYGNDFGGFANVISDPLITNGGKRVCGPLEDPNFYAQMMVMLVPLALYRLWDEVSPRLKAISAYILAILVLTVVFTFSRGGFVALVIVLALAALQKKVKPGYIIVGFCLLLPLLSFIPAEYGERMSSLDAFLPGGSNQPKTTEKDASLEARSALVKVGWLMFMDHPLLGVGTENFVVHSRDYAQELGLFISERGGQGVMAHNFYLQVLAETGVLGFVCFAASVLYAFAGLRASHAQLKKQGRLSLASITVSLQLSIVGYLVTALFLQGGGSDRWLWLLVAIATAIRQEVQRGQKKRQRYMAGRELCVS